MAAKTRCTGCYEPVWECVCDDAEESLEAWAHDRGYTDIKPAQRTHRPPA